MFLVLKEKKQNFLLVNNCFILLIKLQNIPMQMLIFIAYFLGEISKFAGAEMSHKVYNNYFFTETR